MAAKVRGLRFKNQNFVSGWQTSRVRKDQTTLLISVFI